MKPIIRRTGAVAILAASLWGGGCEEGRAPAADPLVRDSAGVRVVEYPGPPDTVDLLALSPEPIYAHGNREGHYPFQHIRAGRLLPGGGAVISDAANREVVLFAPDGSFDGVLAGAGEGPGDVGGGTTSLIVLGPDSILAQDALNAQFTLFAGGAPVRNTSLREHFRELLGTMAAGADSAGNPLLVTYGWPGESEPPPVDTWLRGHVIRLDLGTRVFDTLAAWDGMLNPAPGPVSPFLPDGSVAFTGQHFVQGRADTPELIWRRQDGAVSRIVRWHPDRRYPTAADWEAFLDRWRRVYDARDIAQSDRARLMRELRDRYQPDYDVPLPLWQDLVGDDEGRVWMADYQIDTGRQGASGYVIMGPDGQWLGRVEAPERIRILDVARGLLLAVVEDEMDAQSIVVYGVTGRKDRNSPPS